MDEFLLRIGIPAAVVAAVGVAVGARQYTVAIGATTLVILTLFVLRSIDKERDLFHLVIRAVGPLAGRERAVRMMAVEPRVCSMGRG